MLIGINLLREGLDILKSNLSILDADNKGSRNKPRSYDTVTLVTSMVVLSLPLTASMKEAIDGNGSKKNDSNGPQSKKWIPPNHFQKTFSLDGSSLGQNQNKQTTGSVMFVQD